MAHHRKIERLVTTTKSYRDKHLVNVNESATYRRLVVTLSIICMRDEHSIENHVRILKPSVYVREAKTRSSDSTNAIKLCSYQKDGS